MKTVAPECVNLSSTLARLACCEMTRVTRISNDPGSFFLSDLLTRLTCNLRAPGVTLIWDSSLPN